MFAWRNQLQLPYNSHCSKNLENKHVPCCDLLCYNIIVGEVVRSGICMQYIGWCSGSLISTVVIPALSCTNSRVLRMITSSLDGRLGYPFITRTPFLSDWKAGG